MVVVATPVAQAAALATLPSPAHTALQGFPASLFGFTPAQDAYWREPGLPFLTHEIWQNAPLGYGGLKLIWDTVELTCNNMAPRFPLGCRVNVAPVYEKKNLQVGKVYLYEGKDEVTGKETCQLGRLCVIGDNYLVVNFDNGPTPVLWPLRPDEVQAVWDLYEVTHYVSWPIPDEVYLLPATA